MTATGSGTGTRTRTRTTTISQDRRRVAVVRVVLLTLALLAMAVPFCWIILTAFKLPVDAASVPPVIISPFTSMNFSALGDDGFAQSLWNSTVITVTTTVSTLVLGVPAGYAFARGKFVGRRFLGSFLLFSRMVPPVIFIIPLFLFFHDLNLIGTFPGSRWPI